MTYEEWIIKCAEEKCDKLYKWELICGSTALTLMLIYLRQHRIYAEFKIGYTKNHPEVS